MTMSPKDRTKINRLITEWVPGTPSAASYLVSQGLKPDTLVKYKLAQWLESFGRGAYKRYGEKVDWLGALYTLQTQLKLPIHAGGKTALELQGYAHYLRVRQVLVYLYGPYAMKKPSWFNSEQLGVEILVTRTNLFPAETQGFVEHDEKDFSVRMSAPERAMMEMLHLVPKHAGFSEAYLIMQNLVSLRPDVVQTLLELCRSVKVKRLFLYMADRCEHAWLSELALEKVDLGRGKYVIVQKGRYNAKYKITVPAESEVMPG